MSEQLSNHSTVIVTGASKGIGADIAEQFALAGYHVVMLSRTESLLRERCDQLREQGCACSYYAVDVLDFSAMREIIENLTRLDGLVNNASGVIIKKFQDYNENDFDTLINLNVKSYFILSQLAANKIKQRDDGGFIINVSSIMGKVAQPQNSPRPQTLYIMAKHAIEGLTKALSVELAQDNIRVNSVCPTYVLTDLVNETMQDDEMRNFYLDKIPLHRFAEKRDVSDAVLFLSSSKMITGESILVDGGWCAV